MLIQDQLFPNRISFPQDVFLKIYPEGKHQVNDDGRCDRYECGVNKIEPNDTG